MNFVQTCVQEFSSFTVIYLLSYSLEVNSNEYLNADLKEGVTKRAPARSKKALKKAAVSPLRTLQMSPTRVKIYFDHEPIRYAAWQYYIAGLIVYD